MSRSNRVRNKERKDGSRNTSSFSVSNNKRNTKNENNVVELNVYNTRKIQTTELIKPKTFNQQRYFDSIKRNTITIGAGMAGSGKTLIPAFLAVQMLNAGTIDKIVYIRAYVDSQYEKDYGALPGDHVEKVAPLVRPLYRSFLNFMPEATAKYLCNQDNGKVEVLTLRFLEGETFNRSFVITDELEFFNGGAVRLVLGRLGNESKLVLSGDDTQACTKNTKLIEKLIDRWYGMDNFNYVKFDYDDCQRNPIIIPALKRIEDL